MPRVGRLSFFDESNGLLTANNLTTSSASRPGPSSHISARVSVPRSVTVAAPLSKGVVDNLLEDRGADLVGRAARLLRQAGGLEEHLPVGRFIDDGLRAFLGAAGAHAAHALGGG
jgi:hypothetical protein